MVLVERLPHSSLTYAITWTLNPCFARISFICKAMAFTKVSTISKKPMVTWWGSHLSFKKCTMRTNVSTLAIDIHKSKLIVQVLQDSRAKEIYFSFIFFVIFSKISVTNTCIYGKLKRGFCFKTSLQKNGVSTKDNGTSSLAMNNAKSFSNCFCWGSFFE